MADKTLIRCDLGQGAWIAADLYAGSGPAIVLLHGIPGGRQSWHPVAGSLAGAGPVLVPDLLGFGESSDPPGDFHAFAQAEAVARLLDHTELSDVHLVGFDFGGPVSVLLVHLAPTRISSLTLIATNVFSDTPIPGLLKLAAVPGLGEAVFFAMCSWPGLAGLWFGAVAAKGRLRWRTFLAHLPSRRGRRWTRRIFLDSLRHLRLRYARIEATLSSISAPTLIIWGDRDPFFPVSVGRRTAGAIAGAEFQLLPDCGHFVPLEHPETLARLIRRLVDVGKTRPPAGPSMRGGQAAIAAATK